MILKSNKIIFVHIPKTGGTSVEVTMNGRGEPEPTKHLTIQQLKDHAVQHLTHDWNDYHKFTIVRNPWDCMVSWWKWRSTICKRLTPEEYIAADTPESFKTFITSFPDLVPGNPHIPGGRTYMDYIAIDDEIEVDTILRFENLQSDWSRLVEKLKLPYNKKLPYVNKTQRRHYSCYYDEFTIDLVNKKFHKEIDIFNYEFEYENP